MTGSFRKEISKFLIIAFLFFLIPGDTYSLKGDAKLGLKLIKEGEKFFREYQYSQAIDKFHEAEKYVKSKKNLSRIYLGLSRSYYAMGLMAQVREAINKLTSISIKWKLDEGEFPRGYLKIYKEILAEAKNKQAEEKLDITEGESEQIPRVEKTGEESKQLTKKGSPAGVIEKAGVKKKKKKSLVLPIVLGAVALGAAAMLMGKKTDGGSVATNTASVHIESTPSGAQVFVDGVNKGVTTPCDFTVSEGNRNLKLLIDGWGETENTLTIAKDQSISFNVQLAPYIYSSVASFSLDPRVPDNRWDGDLEGNIYTIYNDDGSYILKYNRDGSVVSDVKWSGTQIDVSRAWIYVAKRISRLYILIYKSERISLIYVFDLNSTYLTQYSFNKSEGLFDPAVASNGNHYFNVNQNKVTVFDSEMNRGPDILLNTNNLYLTIRLSDHPDGFFYISNSETFLIEKYLISSGAFLNTRGARDAYRHRGYYFTNQGEGDTERVFFNTTNGSNYRIEISDGDGNPLSVSPGLGYLTILSHDSDANIYAGTGPREISRYEPSWETEGEGFWESTYSVLNRSGFRSGGQNRIIPLRKRLPGKSDTKKNRDSRKKIK